MLISLSDAAQLLGYSTSGLRKLVRRRAIRFFQLRPHSPIKFRREWLDEFVAAHCAEPGAPADVKKRQKPKAGSIVEPAFGFDPSLLNL